ncbi:MAG: RNA polymerase factor sigma-54 [Bacteroidia bacterium]|nr:RNA polymerase factor sigma-54 [Bacteroidia bacterium]
MSKISLQQRLSQKLSPQQIQYIKLLQIPTSELSSRISEELQNNEMFELPSDSTPADDSSETNNAEDYPTTQEKSSIETKNSNEVSYDELNRDDKEYDYKTKQEYDPDAEQYEAPIVGYSTLYDKLLEQVEMTSFTETEYEIALQIIGSIDEDGYLRTEITKITDDIAFLKGITVEDSEVEQVLHQIQTFDPPGVGATTLQECLLLQLERMPETLEIHHAKKVIRNCWDEFSKKHFDKIQHKLNLTKEEYQKADTRIKKLNPKPGESQASEKHYQIIPDFILKINDEETGKNKIQIDLNKKTTPNLKLSKQYQQILKESQEKAKKGDKAAKETVHYLQEKLESARTFIEAIKQRGSTLTETMKQIVAKQEEYFLSKGDISKLKPMILKDIAENLGMDISTVSRVANSKYVQTDWGILQLKFFFSEGISTESGEEVSNREIKNLIQELISSEDKIKPFSDERICEYLNEKGYNIARRTVAKYREQLNIPVARLRKETA